jgi:hypothetical protein
MESRLVSKKREIERELRLGVRHPARKRYLIARLIQIENDIGSLGLTPDEVETNNIQAGTDTGSANNKIATGKGFLIPPADWLNEPNQNNTNQSKPNTSQESMQAHRDRMLAELNDNGSPGDFWSEQQKKVRPQQ